MKLQAGKIAKVFRYFIIFAISIILFSFNEPDTNSQLFSIGRSKDANEIIYSLNLEKGNKLNSKEPIRVFWLKRTENNKIESLTWIQQKFSYGVVYLEKNESSAKFHFAGYDARILELKKNSKGKYNVYTISQGKEVIVNRIYITISGGTFWFPIIPKVELYAKTADNGQIIIETIKRL